MRVLLLNAPSNRTADFPPLGLLSVGTVLRNAGHEVRVVDAPAHNLDAAGVVRIATAWQPELIGMTTFIVGERQTLQLARSLKSVLQCPIILGGPHASSYPRELLEKEPAIDAAVVKEGEQTALELLEVLREGRALSEVRGLVFRDEHGTIVSNPPRPIIGNLDDLPFPDRSFVDLAAYQPIPNMYRRLPATSVITSRGCPFHCTYCFEAGVLAQKYRVRSIPAVIEELKHLAGEYGIREVAFWDDEFVLNNRRTHAMCEAMIQAGLDISWSCFARVGSVTAELLRHMKQAGCWSVSYGIESGNQELLDFLKKGCTLAEVRDAVRWAHEAGIETRCSFMLGLPGESPVMAQKTIDFAIELDVDYAQFFATNPLRGTPLFEDSHNLGRFNPEYSNDWSSYANRAAFIPHGYRDEQEVLQTIRSAHRQFYFRPAYVLKRLRRIRHIEDIAKYYRGLKMLMDVGSVARRPAET